MWSLEWIFAHGAACWDISRWYAHVFRAYHRIAERRPQSHPEGVSRIPRAPSGVRMLIVISLSGVRKRRVPLAKSPHRSAVQAVTLPAPLRGAKLKRRTSMRAA